MILALLLACAPEPAPALPALPEGDVEAALAACRAEAVPELKAGTCVEAAARAGHEGRQDLAGEACVELPKGSRWWQECHFRAGEELGKGGWTAAALSHCGLAGDFARFCLTHAGWGLPATTQTDAQFWVDLAATTFPEALRVEASDVLRARWWFNHYYGTGDADPAEVRRARAEEGPHARGAWMLEMARLTGGDLPLTIAVWQGLAEPPPGRPLPPEARVGRYDMGVPIPGEAELPRVRTFGDARRIIGVSVDEDLVIAWLEALYFNGAPTGEPFRGFLDDPRARVRYTAFRLYRILPSEGVEATLRSYAADPDPVVRAHVADALKHQTWRGRPQRPGGSPPG